MTNTAGKTAGTSRVERILDGCVVMENWTGVPGPYQGKSFNTYNPADGTWTQHWVDSTGASVLMNGKFEGRNLVYTREFVRRDGKPTRARMTFFNLEDGRVRQFVEQSMDEGRTWTPQIDLTARARDPSNAHPSNSCIRSSGSGVSKSAAMKPSGVDTENPLAWRHVVFTAQEKPQHCVE